ncbi:MAG TPA: hypothetical protein VFU28_10185 [Vicinamibacterales bacterium]|nr:hypothetical protein [Vicinamibacterales bacterium]
MTRTLVGALVILILLVPARTFGQGGPPLITDDPDTPGPGYWEINLAAIVERSMSQRRTEQPLADINYGIGKTIQLKFEMPWLHVRAHGQSAGTGPGNTNSGVKWRFLGEEGTRVAWSIYPQLEVNSSKSMSDRGLVDEGPQFFLPTEFTVEMGHVELNGEIGRNFVRNVDDEWLYGVSTEIEMRRGLELLGELHGEQRRTSPTELIVEGGGRQRITRQIVLLAAVGTAVHGAREDRIRFRLYAGLQFNLPRQYPFGTSPSTVTVVRPR